MPLEASRDPSIPELLRKLSEKLDLERIGLRETPIPPPAVSAASLESMIESLETSARDILKLIPTLRNIFRPVNWLPPELLSRIARDVPGDGAQDASSVIPLTHVCRYWRESIVSSSEHWTLISNNQNELTALSLERAKTACLGVTIDMGKFRADPGSFGLTSPQIQNIDSLFVYDLPGIEELTQALPNFPQSTPNLRSLTLRCAYTSAKWARTIDPFESLAHTLKRLSLFNVPLYPSLRNLRSLTDLTLRYHYFDLDLDTLLAFLEQNRSLERATLDIRFIDPSLRNLRRAAIRNRLQRLSISCNNPMNARALISGIVLRRGAHLEILSLDHNTGLNDILSEISTTHLANLTSPAFLEYQSYPRDIRLTGPNGSFSFSCFPSSGAPFVELPLFSLANIREFRLNHHTPQRLRPSPNLPVLHLASFPALETFAVECDTDVLHFLSALLPNPSASPSLKTLAFLNSIITEDFMEKLVRFASDRKNTSAARLHHVVIVDEDGRFPSAALIHALGKHVPVVDVRFGTKLPTELT